MEDKEQIKKKLKKLVIIFGALIIPGLLKVIDSNAFENVRKVDIALLFLTGVILGIFITLLRIYLQFKKAE